MAPPRDLPGLGVLVALAAVSCHGAPNGTPGGGGAAPSSTAASGGAPAGGQGGDGYGGGAAGGCAGGPDLRVLFIGNSHTYVNDVPALVRELACSAGTSVVTTAVTAPGADLMEHVANPEVLDAIQADAWDFVLIQDQQQVPGYRLDLLNATSAQEALVLVDAIRANRPATTPLFYMVWPRLGGDAQNCSYYPLLCTFEGATIAVAQGYGLYAERTSSDVVPVALAWADVWDDVAPPLPPAELWSDDGSHAAVAGSYLAASMITARLLGSPMADVRFDAGLDPTVASYLRSKGDDVLGAHESVQRFDTEERVRITCGELSGCDLSHDTAGVIFSLSPGSCEELANGTATIVGRVDTTLSCPSLTCSTVGLRRWSEVAEGTIPPGDYTVRAHIDVDRDGLVGAGEPLSCAPSALGVGSGVDAVFSTFAPAK